MVEYCAGPRTNREIRPVGVDSSEDLFKLVMNSEDDNRLGLKAFLFPATLNQNH